MPNGNSYCCALEPHTTNFSNQLKIIHIVQFGSQLKNIYVCTPWVKTTKKEKGVRSGLAQKACFIQQCRFSHTIKWREHFRHIKEGWRSFLQSEADFSSRLLSGIHTPWALLFRYCRHNQLLHTTLWDCCDTNHTTYSTLHSLTYSLCTVSLNIHHTEKHFKYLLKF